MKKNLIIVTIRSFILFTLFFSFYCKIDAKTTKKSNSRGALSAFGLPGLPSANKSITQKDMEKIQTMIADALLILQRFEGILDNISNIISQKFSKMTAAQARHAENCIHQVHEMRSQLYQAREKIQDIQPKHPSQLQAILSHIGYLLSITVEYADSLNFSLSNKFKKIKKFDIEKTLTRSGQKDQSATMAKNMFQLQDLSINIEQTLNDFDLTKINKAFQFLNTWLVNPFFKGHLNSILYYATIWGIPTSLFLWQWGGRIANNAELKHLVDTKVMGRFDLIPKNPPVPFDAEGKLFERIHTTGEKNGIYKQELAPNKTFQLMDTYKKTLGLPLRFYYWICEKFGHSSGYFSSPDLLVDQMNSFGHGKKVEFEKRQISYKARILGSLDDTMSGYFSQQYPILTMGLPLIFPTIQETWTKSIWPTIYGNVIAAWSKLMGGVFENRTIDGMYELIVNDFTLDDVIGMENEKIQLQILIEYLLNPTTFTLRHGNKIDKAFVFTGPTRTGKTYLFKAFVGSLQKKLQMLGRSIRSVRAYEFPVALIQQAGITVVMNYMRSLAPAIFFIDEIDLVRLQRTTDSTILADFLTGLGNVLNDDPTRPVVLFCATNKIENLDKALRTKGRLGREIRFDYPSYTHRKEFLEKILKKLGLTNRKIDIDALVQQLGEQAYETINYVLHGAMMQASVSGVPFSQEYFEEAIDQSIRGIMHTSRKDLVEVEQKILAAHFAGHIVIFLLLALHEVLHKVTIKAVAPHIKEEAIYADLHQKDDQKQKKIVFGSIFVSAKGDTDKLATREMRILIIKRLLSGYIAEELLLGSCGYTCHPEYRKEAYEIALALLLAGIEYDSLSDAMKTEYSKRAIELLDQYMQEVRLLFTENIDLLRYASEKLLDKEEFSQKQIQELYEDFKRKKEEERVEKEQNDQEEAATKEEIV